MTDTNGGGGALQLVITMNPEGSLNVSGPIQNKLFAYGMLEMAKDAIRQHHIDNQNLVQPVGVAIPQNIFNK